jgi:general secretion pathway protein D
MNESLEGEITIIPDEDTNSLIIRTSPRNYPSVLEIIKKLDLFPQQVLIEVLILDLTLDEETELGLQWAAKGTAGGTTIAGAVLKSGSTLGSEIGTATATFLSGGSFFVGNPGNVIALLRAFSADSKANILANPILVTSDNKPASISITDEIPIESSVLTTNTTEPVTSTTIEYRSVGIKLKILPKINSDNYVNLVIDQEISSVGVDTFGATTSPSFLNRQLSTEVVLKDNQILVMGGLIRTDVIESSEGLPGLRNIPFIGKLFGTESSETKKTELMFFITPHIISNDEDSEFVTNQFRKRLGNIKISPSNS